MLSEEQLEIIEEALVPLFQYLEHEVIVDIARRIQKTMTYTRTAELQAHSMSELGYSPARIRKEAMKLLTSDPEYRKAVAKNTLEYKREIRDIINNITKEAYKANDEIVAGAGNMAWIDDLSVWKQNAKELTDNSFLPRLVEMFSEQTAGALKNMTQTTGFKTMNGYEAVENAYQRELDKAIIKVCSGAFSRDKVIQDTVHNLAQSGLRSIDFASGYSMQLDTATRMAVRTGCHQMTGKVLDNNIMVSGENLVYVSKHWGARNTGIGHANHEQWQGHVYFVKEGQDYRTEAKRIGQDYITDLWRATGYSVDGAHENDPLGLYGYNCRHNHHPWFEGVSSYPKESPEPSPVIINGKEYDYYAVTQKMRALERNIRALKREKEALKALGMDTQEINVKISRKRREYKEFCQSARVNEKPARLRYECGTSDLKKTQAWKKYHDTSFENDLKAKTLGASDAVGDSSEPVYIGQIDISKAEDAIEYYGNQIRDSEIEKLIVIDKEGRLYYNEGVEDAVSVGNLDLSECIVLHNHPKTNGIMSFGEDDFNLMRYFQSASYRLVNEKYDYRVEIIKPIDMVTYNQAWRWAIEDMMDEGNTGELQHRIMQSLANRGYIAYEQKSIVRKPKG
nr:MAG TPA: minor capsid protein [Caudoviricetes sp.]